MFQEKLYLTNPLNHIKKLNYKDLIIFLIPTLIFAYYLYVYNPGIILWDSYSQFHMIASGKFHNWHPFFHTFILMMCLKLFNNNPISISILQILIFSTMWTVICKYFRNDDLKTEKIFILQVIVTLIISLIPLNAMYSIFYYKDVLFSYFLMFLCFLIKVAIDKKGQFSLGFILVFTITMSFVAQLRGNGLLLILILLIALIIYFFKNHRNQKLHIIIPALTIVLILLISSLNVAYDVEDNQKDFVMTKTSHLLASYDMNHKLDKNDEKVLHEFMSKKSIKENYDIVFSDPLYNNAPNMDVYEKNKGTYISMAMENSIKHPKHFISYLFKSSPIVWKVPVDKTWNHREGADTLIARNANIGYYKTINDTPITSYDNATFKDSNSQLFNDTTNMIRTVTSNELLDTLLDNPALYMYLSLIIIAGAYILTRTKDLMFVYLPNLLNIILIFLSTPAQQIRYLYPNFLVFYMLIIIMIGLYGKKKFEAND